MLIFRTILLFLCLTATAVANDPYEVTGIRLDVRGDSDSQAKTEALRLAGAVAFNIVVKRLLPAEQQQKAKPPLTAKHIGSALSVLIADLQISNERFGQGRYLAEATVRFKRAAMRNLFAKRGVYYAENFSAPLLILPLQRRGNDLSLWSGDNLLLKTISEQSLPKGLLSYVVPLGDIEDINSLTAESAESFMTTGNAGVTFANIIQRYGAGGVILMQGDIKGDTMDISARMLSRGKISDFTTRTYNIESAGVEVAVLQSLQDFHENWKTTNLIIDGANKTLYAVLNNSSLKALNNQLQKLRQVAIVSKAHAVRVSARQSVIEIGFRASLEQLQATLFNYGMRLDRRKSTGIWQLRNL